MWIEARRRSLFLTVGLACLATACRGAQSQGARSEFVATQGCALPVSAPAPMAGFMEFGNYAWDLFVAVNWPVTAGQRGVPDCGRMIGAPGPTVWESYKTVEQIFLPNAADPGPWTGGPATVSQLRFRSKAPDGLPLESAIAQAVGGWLIDQQANPTYYQVAVNEVSYDYVRTNGFYNATILNSAARVDFPTGALEVKGAWRIMQGVNASRYHTVAAQVMTFDASGQPTGQYRPVTVGLTGLHVVYKAAGFPQWIWATFEHVDNAPDAATPTGAWSYFNASCAGPYCTPNVSPARAAIPFGTPNPITRVTPIRPEIAAVNATWQSQLAATPFRFYRLVVPQWPADPSNPGNPQGTPTPGTAANVVLESYIQPTSSCMDCHSTARVPNNQIKTNYSFLFLFAQSPAAGGH